MNHASHLHDAGRSAVNESRGHRSADLRGLLAGLTDVAVPDLAISDISLDSRKMAAGGAFLALPGQRSHGIAFASQAIAAGARVILWEPGANVTPPVPLHGTPHVALLAVPHLSAAVGAIADRFFGAPSRAIEVTGVTGTNGKTTTAYVIATALEQLGSASAYGGTLGIGPVTAIRPGSHTTPDCITVHRQLDELRGAGVTHLAMEVSSHALDQRRVANVCFDTAVFTNLTHDHLDYHGTLDAYGEAKARLFAWPQLRHAVINIDDAFGQRLAQRALAAQLTVCSRQRLEVTGAQRHVFATHVEAAPEGLTICVDSSWGSARMQSRFIGQFNVDNVLAALAVLLGSAVPLQKAVAALEHCAAPPGRMEAVAAAGVLAIVDYAHTPDALEKALLAARSHCTGKLICVFGCGGDRDAAKRPVMGAIAERNADLVIVTDDNPRTEDGDAIVAGIVGGFVKPARLVVERDRARAIEQAIETATRGDVVLIAGKGHEDYQIIGIEKRYFSDRDVAQAALRRRP